MAPRLLDGLAAAAALLLLLLPAPGQAAGLYKAGSDVVRLTDANFEVCSATWEWEAYFACPS